jgi:hypothetical protein
MSTTTTTTLRRKAQGQRWDAKKAGAWYNALPWLVGCNYVTSTAVNQLEMWQADTFDPATIDRELGWLAGLGMNSVRVFLHDLAWAQDARGFLLRAEQFLEIAHKHGIGTMFVFFDSCWYPFPYPGRQRDPEPGVHNSFWLQSPGLPALQNEKEWPRLEDYVRGFVGHFRQDARVQVWDIWNEPDNPNTASYGTRDLGLEEKSKLMLPMLAQAFDWARAADPVQPLTSAVWMGAPWIKETLSPLHKYQLNASDVISFHRYEPLEQTRMVIPVLKEYGRPILCTEYMARGAQGSTFEAILPYFKQEKIAAYNWGSIAGKSQTNVPWDSWQNPYRTEPPVWFHDIFRADGTPYDPKEAELIKSLLGK